MQVTLKDIAGTMGVTITTVHKALNGRDPRSSILTIEPEVVLRSNYRSI